MFAGAGGLSEGFRQAGYLVLAGTDVDPDACATYALNFPGAETLWGDIRRPDLRERVVALSHDVDVLVGGPPCQAFSQVRNHSRLIDDPRNSLYREFVGLVAEVQPGAFLMENVPGMAQMGILEQVTEDLSLDGTYDVNPQLVDAADFGVPQTRKRLIFLGIRHDLGVSPLMPTGSGATSTLALVRIGRGRYQLEVRSEDGESVLARLTDPADRSIVTAEQAISDLAHLHAGRRQEAQPAEELPPAASAYQSMMRGQIDVVDNLRVPRVNTDTVMRLNGIPPGGNYRDLPDELSVRYISGQKWGPSNGTGQLGRAHFYAYRRLHPSIWAWTLNTKADSVYHYEAARALSVREFARLQSFPDRFVVTTDPRRGLLPGRIDGGAAHSRYRQIGNAVPPLLAATLARELARLVHAGERRVQLQV